MDRVISKSRHKIFFVYPTKIKNCIYPTRFCDYNQFGRNRLHPHAGKNRGVFEEELKGRIRVNRSNWDYKTGILFSELLEYQALKNHYTGKENWKKSKFASRVDEYLKNNNKIREFLNYKNFLSEREEEINRLFSSILKNGIYVVGIDEKNSKIFNDNISCVLTKNNELLFNNRGHHRLSIAKIINLRKIPIKLTVVKNEKIYNDFLILHKQTKL